MKHLALPVSDQERSRRFYESYFGFDARRRAGTTAGC
jgi:catechol 2,3-dioxygenase-like lactoylglutathione lyase family enzyme